MRPGPTVVLQPGEWFFGQAPGVIRTLLGSCVAVTVWHPILRCGGMCHYLLPNRPRVDQGLLVPNGRYGVDALQFLHCEMIERAPLREYHVSCFGGAMMFSGNHTVGQSNMALAMKWMSLHLLSPKQTEMGGLKGRKIQLDLDSGTLEVTNLDPVPYQGEKL